MQFGTWVREQRIAMKLSQTECAARAGMKLQQWNRMEKSAKKAHVETAEAVAAGLGISIAVVLEAAGIPVVQESEWDLRQLTKLRRVPREKQAQVEQALDSLLSLVTA